MKLVIQKHFLDASSQAKPLSAINLCASRQ